MLIRLVLTEIQAFKNEKKLQRNVWKCGQIRTRVRICPHFHTFLCKFGWGSPVCELRVLGQPRLNSALRLSSNHSDRLMMLQGQKKSLRSSVTNFSLGAVKLPLNLVTRTPVRESPLLRICLLKLTEPFWISLPFSFFRIEQLLQKLSC